MGHIIDTRMHMKYRAINAPTVMLMAVLGASGIVGCTDSRTPYQAYVECDADIAAAAAPEEIMSCYTNDWQPWFRAKEEQADGWFARFKAARPRISRLHEEQLVDDEDESILLIVGHTRAGQPAAIEVKMLRVGGRWKIDLEEAQGKGAAGSPAQPMQVSLKPADGPAWYPGELAAGFGRGPDGRCWVSIYHVFRFPDLVITSDCERFASPGTYTVAELTPAGEDRSATVPVKFFDHRHYARQVKEGELSITSVSDGVLFGEFRFKAVSGSDVLAIAGTFSNLPFKH